MTLRPLFQHKAIDPLFGSLTVSEGYASTANLILSDVCLNGSVNNYAATRTGLLSYFFALSIFEDAFESILKCRHRTFDALIGNNSCYAVSYIVFLLIKKLKNYSQFRHQLLSSLKDVSKMKVKIIRQLKALESGLFRKTTTSFKQLLVDNGLLIDVDQDFVYLGLAFACAISKQKNEKDFEEINYDNLLNKYKGQIGFELKKNPMIKLVKYWQKTISHINVRTLQYYATFVPLEVKDWAAYLSNKYIVPDARGRLCAASLYSLMTIYHLLLGMPNTLIGVQVNLIEKPKNFKNRFTIYFEVQNNRKMRNIDPSKINPSDPVYVFTGCRYLPTDTGSEIDLHKLREEFSKRNLYDLLFANEVAYPQYPKSLKIADIQPKEEVITQEIARLKKLGGCSLEDPSDFCIVHIYVDSLEGQLLDASEPPVYVPNLGND